jgi:hypothetical protein
MDRGTRGGSGQASLDVAAGKTAIMSGIFGACNSRAKPK